MFGAVSANLFNQRGEEKQVTQAKHFYLALELITWISSDKLIFMGKNTTILEEKRAIFIPESEFVYVRVSAFTWFDFCF